MSSCFLSSQFLRPVGISVHGDKDEGETERASETETEREREESRKGNTVRHDEDKQCVHCPYGLVNILMKEPQPKSHHKLHTDSHSD